MDALFHLAAILGFVAGSANLCLKIREKSEEDVLKAEHAKSLATRSKFEGRSSR